SALNNGKIRPQYLDAIGELLDVETDYLSGGSLDKRIQFTKNINSNYEVLLNNYVAKIDEHPYAMKEINDFKNNSIYKYLSNIFSIFNISIEQFKQLEISDQYQLQEELLKDLEKTVRKYFSEDVSGDKTFNEMERVFVDFESNKDKLNFDLYLDEVVRNKYIKNLPINLTTEDIEQMTLDELFELEEKEQWINDFLKTIDLIMIDFLRKEYSMDELLKELGLNDQKELAQFVIENPEHPISKQLLELYERLEQHKEENKNQQ